MTTPWRAGAEGAQGEVIAFHTLLWHHCPVMSRDFAMLFAVVGVLGWAWTGRHPGPPALRPLRPFHAAPPPLDAPATHRRQRRLGPPARSPTAPCAGPDPRSP